MKIQAAVSQSIIGVDWSNVLSHNKSLDISRKLMCRTKCRSDADSSIKIKNRASLQTRFWMSGLKLLQFAQLAAVLLALPSSFNQKINVHRILNSGGNNGIGGPSGSASVFGLKGNTAAGAVPVGNPNETYSGCGWISFQQFCQFGFQVEIWLTMEGQLWRALLRWFIK